MNQIGHIFSEIPIFSSYILVPSSGFLTFQYIFLEGFPNGPLFENVIFGTTVHRTSEDWRGFRNVFNVVHEKMWPV